MNTELVGDYAENGMIFTGQDEIGVRMEVIEIPKHKFFIAVQFHPEFKSRPYRPSPPFCGLIRAAAGLPMKPTTQSGLISPKAVPYSEDSLVNDSIDLSELALSVPEPVSSEAISCSSDSSS